MDLDKHEYRVKLKWFRPPDFEKARGRFVECGVCGGLIDTFDRYHVEVREYDDGAARANEVG